MNHPMPIQVSSSKTLRHLVQQELAKQGPQANLNHLDVSQLSDLNGVFENLTFSGDTSQWNISNVKRMLSTFKGATLGANIEQWDTSNVQDMSYCFYASRVASSISNWKLTNLRFAHDMFRYAMLDQNPDAWEMPCLEHCTFIMTDSNLDIHLWTVGPDARMNDLWSDKPRTGKYFSLFPKSRIATLPAMKTYIERFYEHHAFEPKNLTEMLSPRTIGWHHALVRTLYPFLPVHAQWTDRHDRLLELALSVEPNTYQALTMFDDMMKNATEYVPNADATVLFSAMNP